MTAMFAPMMTVILETARLRLRPHRMSDLDARAAMTGNPHVMRYFGGTHDREEAWARLLRYAGHWALMGYGLFAVEERDGGRFVGEVGLANFHRSLGADFDGVPEAAWMLDQWAEGKGYATEAVNAALGWHETKFQTMRQVCMIDRNNLPSMRLAKRLGFRPFREANYHGQSIFLHDRTPPLPTDGKGG